MASPPNGLRKGTPMGVLMLVDADTTAIRVGDFLVAGSAGYVKRATTGAAIVGQALEACSSPSADGGVAILVDISHETIWEVGIGNGTLTQAMQGKTCDVSADDTINVAGSTYDDILIVECDVTNQKALIQKRLSHSGVV